LVNFAVETDTISRNINEPLQFLPGDVATFWGGDYRVRGRVWYHYTM